MVEGIDGTDKLTGIERLQFADQQVVLAAGAGLNASAVGVVRILDAAGTPLTTPPAVGQVLSASVAGVTDANNISATNPTGAITGQVAYYWQTLAPLGGGAAPGQFVYQNIVDANGLPVTGATMTVTPALSATLGFLGLRVRAVYQDTNGVIETVFSALSAPVADAAPVAAPAAE